MAMIEIIVGFAVALLSGLGIGGGGMLVIYLVLVKEVEQLTAQGINLIFFLFSSGAAILRHIFVRRLDFKLIGTLAFFGSIGAVIGSICVRACEPELVRASFGWLLLISGLISLVKN